MTELEPQPQEHPPTAAAAPAAAPRRQPAPLRVYLLADSYLPTRGGGEVHAQQLAERLCARDLATTVLTRRVDRRWPARERLRGVEIRRLWPSGPGSWAKHFSNLPLATLLWRERQRYDALLVCGFRAFGPTAVACGHRLRKPCLLRAEVAGELSGAFSSRRAGAAAAHLSAAAPVRWLLERRRRLLLGADCLIAISDAVASEYRAAGADPGRIERIPNGTELARFHPVSAAERAAGRAALGLPAGRPLAIYTGKLNRYKGLETLLEAWAALAPEHHQALLVLVGSGAGQTLSIEPALRARAAAPDLAARVRFAGAVDDVAPWLKAADLFVFPSEAETFGIALLEAMASGLPAVATDIPGLRELLSAGESGELVPPLAVAPLAATIDALLADPGRRQRLGEQAARAARAYDIEAIAARYTALLRALCA